MAHRIFAYLPLSLALSLTACTAMQPQPTGRPITAAEIEALFPGHSFTLIGMKSGNELVAYADREYCTFRYLHGTQTKTVQWYTSGNRHCCIKKGKEVCGMIYEVEKGVYKKYTDGRHTHTMKNFESGNQI